MEMFWSQDRARHKLRVGPEVFLGRFGLVGRGS
jgi:hypothetical protein